MSNTVARGFQCYFDPSGLTLVALVVEQNSRNVSYLEFDFSQIGLLHIEYSALVSELRVA